MNADTPRLPSTEITSRDIGAIWSGVLLVVYLGVTALLLTRSESDDLPIVLLHLGVLGVVAFATWSSRVPFWLRLWAPLGTLLFLYSEIPMLLRAIGHDRMRDPLVMSWEHALFGFQPAIEWSTRWHSAAGSEFLHAAYASFYVLIYIVPALLYATGRRRAFEEASFALLFTYIVCCACYIAFPVAGPRYLFTPGQRDASGLITRAVRWLLESRSSEGTAFPSSHVALATAASVLAVRHYGVHGLLVVAISLCMALGAVYGGFHYGVDVIAGAMLGIVATLVALAMHRRLSAMEAYAKASAPT